MAKEKLTKAELAKIKSDKAAEKKSKAKKPAAPVGIVSDPPEKG